MSTTACKWDEIIPFEPMWANVKRLLKPRGVFVTTASQPFTSKLVMSNPSLFKHHWIWEKERGTGFQIAKYRPMMKTEDIICMSYNTPTYNPQMLPLDTEVTERYASSRSASSPLANIGIGKRVVTARYPLNILKYKRERGIHPTQKPVALLEYLIRTYTNEGDTVMDICMGSGTTIIAAIQTGRNAIGIEKDEKYFEIAKKRIESAQPPLIP